MTAHRVAAIGLASWDRFLVVDRYPEAGSYAIVRQSFEQAGGTTTNTATALARLGVAVTVAAVVGDDRPGAALRDQLAADGCDARYVVARPGEATDASIIIAFPHGDAVDRAILWQQGARLRRGDFLPIEELFAHDLVILDVDDPALRSFLVDLPSHVSPRTRLLGPLTYLTELPAGRALDLALRHDYVVGADWQLEHLTGADELDQAIDRFQTEMRLSQARLLAVTRGADGCLLVTRDERVSIPACAVDVVDTTGAGDAFAAGLALGILERQPLGEIGRIANALGALATTAYGARAGLPSRDELERFMARNGPTRA